MPAAQSRRRRLARIAWVCGGMLGGLGIAVPSPAQLAGKWVEGNFTSQITADAQNEWRTYTLVSDAPLRDHQPAGGKITFAELPDHARLRTGNILFDGLYALAVAEARQNSVGQIRDWAYAKNEPLNIEAFQTGEFWTYVWTRDLAYSVNLALAGFDPSRAENSLRFKTSARKPSVTGGVARQIIQDTGSGGSWPVSSDRIVWIFGADAALKFLPEADRTNFQAEAFSILRDTLEQDRKIIFDPGDGLYRGEQSFLDWREQTYPLWTKDNVVAIAASKSLSVNAACYFALRTASEYAARLGFDAARARYSAWAADLKAAINQRFYDADAGLYSTCLLTDAGTPVRERRYDLLGESLAILAGVADDARAKSVIEHYPVGPFGPPVVWPEERAVPVYHNHAIWPFVTAYWLKAARLTGNGAAVDAGIRSLLRGAAFNLSNMENFDFASGLAEVKDRELNGPVINSRRQLWSVAGYLAMVQDVVFGLETSCNGIRFRPFVTGRTRNELFAGSDRIELKDFRYRGKILNLRLHLPPQTEANSGAYVTGKVELNGDVIGGEFVAADKLAATNDWEIFLELPRARPPEVKLRLLAAEVMERECFAPAQPQWSAEGQGGLAVKDGRLVLHFRAAPATNCSFTIYRDGKLCAGNITADHWMDHQTADFTNTAHFYTVEARDETTGNASHLSPSRCFLAPDNSRQIRAAEMRNRGGELAEGRYFMNWGRPDHELVTTNFLVDKPGHYLVRAEFSNGAGPVNTGITCALKRLEIRKAGSGSLVAGGYLVMPQSGDWQRWDLSTPVPAILSAREAYTVKIFEDDYSRNMSYLDQDRRYTAGNGGGDAPYNFVNIASLRFLRVAP